MLSFKQFLVESDDEITNTVKAYKLFKRDSSGGLHTLYVGTEKTQPVGQWINAEMGEKNEKGQVKAKGLGSVKPRPGWHSSETPVATHIGGKTQPHLGKPDYRKDDEVWAEVDVPNHVDWQSVANSRARVMKNGKMEAKSADIQDQIPHRGHYKYKTNPNMHGNWLVSGQIRINKVLSDDEVKSINDKHGVQDLPRIKDLKK
jgi:hypothetical protein